MTNGDRRRVAAAERRPSDRSKGRGAARPLATLVALAFAAAAGLVAPVGVDEAQAQRLLVISGAKRTTSVGVTVGKTEDIRIDSPFNEVTVGDPDVADVTPLTDQSLSILGKKIGITRVSIYGEDKRQLGIFDVEVSYDVTRLAGELGRLTAREHPGVDGQRPHSAVGHLARRGHARQGGRDRPSVRTRYHQYGAGAAAAAGHAGGAVRRGYAPSRSRARRPMEHRSARTRYRQNIGRPGAGQTASGAGRRDRLGRPHRHLDRAVRLPVRDDEQGRAHHRRRHQRARGEGPDPKSRASPIWSPCPATPRASSPAANIRSRCRKRSAWSPSTTRSTAWASPSPRPCCRTALINLKIEPEVSELDTSHPVHDLGIQRSRR